MTEVYFDKLYEAARQKAESLGAEVFELYYSGGEDLSAETFRDELSGFSAGQSGRLSVRMLIGGKIGTASSTLATPEEAMELLSKAAENAKLVEKDEEALFCEGGQTYREVKSVPFTMPSAREVKETAMRMRNAAYASSEKISDGTSGGAYAAQNEIFLYTSKGLRLSAHSGGMGAYVYSVLEEGEEKRDGFESAAKPLEEVSGEELAQIATNRAAERFGATLPQSGNYPIVFEGKQMQQILSTFCSVFFAKEVQQGLSLLKDKEGEKIATERLTLIDDPFFEGNPMQIAFDGEGTPTYTKAVIENGVLKTLLYNLESGKKAGKASTGNGARMTAAIGTKVYNLYIVPGKNTREELFKMAEGGIFVTGMKGFHAGANVVSGDFSIESEGFMIRNGQKAEPVKSFTVSGNFFELLKNIAAIGGTIEDMHPGYSKIRCPDILIPSMPISGA